jgi:hypothetical protein
MERKRGTQQERTSDGRAADGPLTLEEFAAVIRASVASVRRMVRSGHLPVYYIGTGEHARHARVARATLERFLRGELTPERTARVRDRDVQTSASPDFRRVSLSDALGDWG